MMEEDQESPNGVVESEDGNTLDSEGVEKSTSMEQTSVDQVSETSHNSDSAELIVTPEGSAEKSPTVSQTTDINVDNSETQLQDESLEFIEGSERDDAAPSISADNNISAHEESKEAVEEGSPYYIIPDDPQFPVIHDPGLSTIFSKYEGCKKLFGGILKSKSIESVNLSWNGLNEYTARHIALCLGRSTTLETLDLSNNSLNDSCVLTISNGLKKNGFLKCLILSMNPFTNEGAISLVEKLVNPKPVLEVLDMGNKMLEKDFKELLNKVQKVRNVQIIFGGYRSNYNIKGPNVKELLLKRAKYVAKKSKQKKNRKDFGQFILKLGEKPVGRDDFEENLKGAKIKLDNDLSEEIMNAFKIKKKVAVQEMKDEYMKIFPETTLVEEKKKKGKKGKAKKGKKNKK